jgi:hypothetical protein
MSPKVKTETQFTLRDAIIRSVEIRNGIPAVELVLNVMNLTNNIVSFNDSDYKRELDNLVATGKIVELDFILPHMDYRIKSIYFPKGTKFIHK